MGNTPPADVWDGDLVHRGFRGPERWDQGGQAGQLVGTAVGTVVDEDVVVAPDGDAVRRGHARDALELTGPVDGDDGRRGPRGGGRRDDARAGTERGRKKRGAGGEPPDSGGATSNSGDRLVCYQWDSPDGRVESHGCGRNTTASAPGLLGR